MFQFRMQFNGWVAVLMMMSLGFVSGMGSKWNYQATDRISEWVNEWMMYKWNYNNHIFPLNTQLSRIQHLTWRFDLTNERFLFLTFHIWLEKNGNHNVALIRFIELLYNYILHSFNSLLCVAGNLVELI